MGKPDQLHKQLILKGLCGCYIILPKENDMEIIWLIGGEKQIFSSGADKFYGRLNYSDLFRFENGRPTGKVWFEKERPKR